MARRVRRRARRMPVTRRRRAREWDPTDLALRAAEIAEERLAERRRPRRRRRAMEQGWRGREILGGRFGGLARGLWEDTRDAGIASIGLIATRFISNVIAANLPVPQGADLERQAGLRRIYRLGFAALGYFTTSIVTNAFQPLRRFGRLFTLGAGMAVFERVLDFFVRPGSTLTVQTGRSTVADSLRAAVTGAPLAGYDVPALGAWAPQAEQPALGEAQAQPQLGAQQQSWPHTHDGLGLCMIGGCPAAPPMFLPDVPCPVVRPGFAPGQVAMPGAPPGAVRGAQFVTAAGSPIFGAPPAPAGAAGMQGGVSQPPHTHDGLGLCMIGSCPAAPPMFLPDVPCPVVRPGFAPGQVAWPGPFPTAPAAPGMPTGPAMPVPGVGPPAGTTAAGVLAPFAAGFGARAGMPMPLMGENFQKNPNAAAIQLMQAQMAGTIN